MSSTHSETRAEAPTSRAPSTLPDPDTLPLAQFDVADPWLHAADRAGEFLARL